jgi:hypothetical protein
MVIFKEIIGSKELSYLQSILGKKIDYIGGKNVRKNGDYNYITFRLLLLSKNTLSIFNEWKETPKENDYYKLHIKREKVNLTEFERVNVNIEGIVSKVDIYYFKGEWDNEVLDYDAAICLTTEKGAKLLLYLFESVSEQIEFTTNLELINKELKYYKLRKSLKNE